MSDLVLYYYILDIWSFGYMYYLLVGAAILLFGGQFFVNGRYQMRCGASLLSSTVLSLGTGIAGALCLFFVNGCSLHSTPFTLLMAFFFAMSGIFLNLFGVYALGRASLSLYSAFTMIGGMIVPSVVGMIFFDEQLTWNKAVCYVLTLLGLSLTVKKEKGAKSFFIYFGVFLCNGASAAISTVFAKAEYAKAASADYSTLCAAWKAVVALAILPVAVRLFRRAEKSAEKPEIPAESAGDAARNGTLPSVPESTASSLSASRKESLVRKYTSPLVLLFLLLGGTLNTVANFFLPVAMRDGGLDGSVVYPMITGGVMIVSTVLGFLNLRKPTRREVLAVIICSLGILFLIVPALLGGS